MPSLNTLVIIISVLGLAFGLAALIILVKTIGWIKGKVRENDAKLIKVAEKTISTEQFVVETLAEFENGNGHHEVLPRAANGKFTSKKRGKK